MRIILSCLVTKLWDLYYFPDVRTNETISPFSSSCLENSATNRVIDIEGWLEPSSSLEFLKLTMMMIVIMMMMMNNEAFIIRRNIRYVLYLILFNVYSRES